MDKNNFLAIDVGTTSIKVSFYSNEGQEIHSVSEKLNESSGKLNSYEIDSIRIMEIIAELIQQSGKSVDLSKVIGIGVTALLGLVVIDKEGNPLRPCMTWADRRASKEALYLKETIGEQLIYERTGKMIDPESIAAKLIWIKQNEPHVFQGINLVTTLKDYIIKNLTNAEVTDPIHASYSLLSDLEKGEWNESLLKDLGIPVQWMPKIQECTNVSGHVSLAAQQMTGLKRGTPVICGGPDGSVGTLGAGLLHPGSAVNVMGTSDVFFTVSKTKIIDSKKRVTFHPHPLKGRWLVGGPMAAAGGVLEKVKSWTRFEDSNSKKSFCTNPGANGLVFITSFNGERTPYWNPAMKGIFTGLSMEHEEEHILQAVMEGTTYPLRELIESLQELNLNIHNVTAVGGGTNSHEWLKIRANILEVPYSTNKIRDSSGFGLALLIGLALEIFHEDNLPFPAIQETYHPDVKSAKEYEKIFKNYKDIRTWFESYYQK